MTGTTIAHEVTVDQFGGLCNLFHTIHCDHIDLTARQAGDVLYYDANNTVCDHSRRITRAVLAYLGLRTGSAAADSLIEEVEADMRMGEGSIPDVEEDPSWRDACPAVRLRERMTTMAALKPDVIVTEEQAIADGAAVDMHAYGYAYFQGDRVATVSDTLFAALQNAFRFAATAGMNLKPADWQAEIDAMDGENGRDPEYIAWLRGRDGNYEGIAGIVPPWAHLGDLLQAFIRNAEDTAAQGEPQGDLYATLPVKALRSRAIWLQRPKPGQWTAFLAEDY